MRLARPRDQLDRTCSRVRPANSGIFRTNLTVEPEDLAIHVGHQMGVAGEALRHRLVFVLEGDLLRGTWPVPDSAARCDEELSQARK